MLHIFKKLIPGNVLRQFRPVYHGLVASFANIWFGRPSDKLIVIGVTGTNGKTTTVNLIAAVLEEAGYQVGFTSTATIKLNDTVRLNSLKMTMPSGWLLHKWLFGMVKQKYHYAILEVSSEGLAQNRHQGINFDIAVFTNLTPEHLESHGGFENYKNAKGKLFEALKAHPITQAKLDINPEIKKTIITNSDDQYSAFYSRYPADSKLTYSAERRDTTVSAHEIRYSPKGIDFVLNTQPVALQLKGQFDVYNAAAAATVGLSQGILLRNCANAMEKVVVVPGRMEVFHANFFNVVVDYAYEPEEMRQLYETVSRWPYLRAIQVLGATGGGRDMARIPLLGEMAAHFADVVVITTDDPYDDDPEVLGRLMLDGAIGQGKKLGVDVFLELDRRKAIALALSHATQNDLVLVTGKGADQKIGLAYGTYSDWDDRTVVKEELYNLQGF